MSSILPLGRTMNFGRSASGGNVRFSLKNCSGVGFIVDTPVAASTLTITEQTAASGGTSQNIAGGITLANGVFAYTQLNGVWTQVTTGISGAVLTVAGSPDLLYVWVPQGALSDGFSYLSGNHSAKALTAVMGDLDVMRKPTFLKDVRS